MGNSIYFRCQNAEICDHQQCHETAVVVRALYRYEPLEKGDLGFDVGEEMEVCRLCLKSGKSWWLARSKLNGKIGYIPRNFVADINSLEAR